MSFHPVPATPADVARARRDAVIGGGVLGLAVAAVALVASTVLVVLGVLAIVLGILFSITVIGALVGVPLIALGVVIVIGGALWGAGGIPLAVVLGAGVGFLWYRQRTRGLPPL